MGIIADGVYFQSVTENQRRVIQPVAERLAGNPIALNELRVSPNSARTRELAGRAVALWRDFITMADAHEVGLPTGAGALGRLFVSSARHHAHAERLVAELAPRVVVLATSQAPEARALVGAGLAHGIPTLYLPHAPMLRDPYMQDLPFDYAGLRGRRELEISSSWGNGRSALVGNPTIEQPTLAPAGDDAPVVLAPSPFGRELVEELCRTVETASPPRVLVAPHPAQDLKVLRRACPAEWTIAAERTVDLLKSGARCVVQHSSGVALEAMLLGIPVVECTFGRSQPPDYPFLDVAFCHHVDDGPAFARALADIRREDRDESRRQEVQAWAHSWCAPFGADAVTAACELILRARRDGPGEEPIRDVWAAVAASSPPDAAET
jgi:hypothetical protein